jgi:hypothetical protein
MAAFATPIWWKNCPHPPQKYYYKKFLKTSIKIFKKNALLPFVRV